MARAAVGLALISASATALASDDVWAVAASQNGVFTAETPCNSAELGAMKPVPDSVITQEALVPDSRILCRKQSLFFVAAEIEDGNLPARSTLFDMFSTHILSDKTAEGTPSQTMIGGKRALLNRQETNDRLAQTGFVEISRTKLIFLVAGAEENSGLSIQRQRELVDHFYASIKVTGK
jgi:hypothetical protein